MEIVIVGIIVSLAAGYLLFLAAKTFMKKNENCPTDCGCSIKEKL